MRRLHIWITLAFILVVVLAACGGADEDDGNGGGGDAATPTNSSPPATPTAATPGSPASNAIAHPTGADEIVLQITTTGGFVPLQVTLTEVPAFILYGDGSLIVPGPVPAIYPPPALPNLLVTRLNEDGIQAVLRAVAAAGLLEGDTQYTSAAVTDSPTTYFSVNADGRTIVVSAYALDFEALPPGTSDEEREGRERLREFMAETVSTFSFGAPAEYVAAEQAPLAIERLRVVSQPAGSWQGDPAITPGEADWPLVTPLAEAGQPNSLRDSRCVVISGADLAPVLEAMQQASAITRWTSGDAEYVLYPRPLLPHEAECDPQ